MKCYNAREFILLILFIFRVKLKMIHLNLQIKRLSQQNKEHIRFIND